VADESKGSVERFTDGFSQRPEGVSRG